MIFKMSVLAKKMLTIGNQKWFQVEGNKITQNGQQLYGAHGETERLWVCMA